MFVVDMSYTVLGESPTVGAPPAIANAIVDALTPYGITHMDIPITPAKIFNKLKEMGVLDKDIAAEA